jgi:hypothetical protein
MRKRISGRRNNRRFKEAGCKRKYRTSYGKNLSAQLNSLIASKIDFEKLPKDNNVSLEVDLNGNVKLNPSNPLHHRWIED